MNIITKNPILVNPEMNYSSLDGTSNSDEIQAFQKWVWYVKGDKSLKTTKSPDGVDGIWGGKTSSAWNKYNPEYTNTPVPVINRPPNPTPTLETVQEDKPKDETDTTKQGWWAKKTKTQKALVIGGYVAVFALIGYIIYKRTKTN